MLAVVKCGHFFHKFWLNILMVQLEAKNAGSGIKQRSNAGRPPAPAHSPHPCYQNLNLYLPLHQYLYLILQMHLYLQLNFYLAVELNSGQMPAGPRHQLTHLTHIIRICIFICICFCICICSCIWLCLAFVFLFGCFWQWN